MKHTIHISVGEDCKCPIRLGPVEKVVQPKTKGVEKVKCVCMEIPAEKHELKRPS